ncbi:hypothetical protein AMAG_09505 [Allomyces macrogynus ATCC 38327]|uniref:Phosphoribulokinase/uridine kinase domain-containing protein n=1 Tax=Allomyces macrogynus (strain ATCC 38327) TaxID=578462 RepID=A0A0L0SQ75_ALLM3|nr:hypothetical protein AMAG_09505 [Allomyces macrogynus ATCC 38327]|eukprot:KNE64490.1 hypothetical protein AMAG_09505 [Allomyces macrogynus ATCC 38327]
MLFIIRARCTSILPHSTTCTRTTTRTVFSTALRTFSTQDSMMTTPHADQIADPATKAASLASWLLQASPALLNLALARRTDANAVPASRRAVVVGLSGPQGSGKSTLASHLVTYLHDKHALRGISISLDDFYLPHADLTALAAANPTNPLLHGRGLPGTHDLPLLLFTLEQLATHWSHPTQTVAVPAYDKAAHSGAGDRSPTPHVVTTPCDVVILDGWMLGFSTENADTAVSNLRAPIVAEFGRANLIDMCTRILPTPTSDWSNVHTRLDHFVHLVPGNLDQIPRIVTMWRTEQERALVKARGTGMTDAQVVQFVQRYVPMYLVAARDLAENGVRFWGVEKVGPVGEPRRAVRVKLGEGREVLEIVEVGGKKAAVGLLAPVLSAGL